MPLQQRKRGLSFKSYPLAGVFTLFLTLIFMYIVVSSHTPLRGYSRRSRASPSTLRVSSHTPLRGYSRVLHRTRLCGHCVSSHTPLRGYSNPVGYMNTKYRSFKSYPLAGVFRQVQSCPIRHTCFKSYPLAGVFCRLSNSCLAVGDVSSHTPLRGYSNSFQLHR